MNRCNLVLIAMTLGLAFSAPAEAQWKWRNQAGQTQYSDLPPPPDVPESAILQRPSGATATRRGIAPIAAASAGSSAASGVPLLAPRAADSELEARRKKTEQDAADAKKKAEDARIAASKAENCSRAREQMRTFDSGQRITRTNEKGEREYLDDAARAAEAKRTRDVMTSECK